MSEEPTICPYTGLRPFTEEESLYFKGRDEHILQVTTQLEEKKFMMVTGASGDGKSSLIFAGLIPQARAGFFKAKYSNWYVADFRPERSPLKNLSKSLASNLNLDPATVEVELGRGFSSLVELFKSSDRFIDQESELWKKSSEDERNKTERQAGNLLILIDQFEEFFTNPENFPGGVPSQESRLLLNIILETIKISLKEDLPIYVVCTMRSDYIGQCAAFRGLPEFIGFSQFFVPRLQRKELHQVIEEPAILSGNRISNRLIDRLIFDLEEGTDQLPILQHALKQIWKAADSGLEEMDLIHYAMVGGMPGDHLPKEAVDRFRTWKENLPEYEKHYLENPALSNVLDIHANKLYEEAAAYCNRNGHPEITTNQAKFIIGMSFACLTRIDESRAVRNRMTLQEITQIVNVPQFTADVVGTVLSIFREPQHTLIRPFIDDGGKDKAMPASTVIDITHEALIRNWKLSKKWADQEYEYYVTFLDFQKQVKRWIDHGKSDDFLLPIGPLTYFENWFKKCRPNQFWINRYNTEEAGAETKLKQSATLLKNSQSFLRKSALRLLITRSFMKYGAARIGVTAGLVVLLALSVFLINQWRVTRNDYVLNQILDQGEILLADKEATVWPKGPFIVDADLLRPGYFKRLINALPGQQKIDAAVDLFANLITVEFKGTPPLLLQSLSCTDSLVQISGSQMDSTNDIAIGTHLNNLNDLVRNQSYYLFLRTDDRVLAKRKHNVTGQAALLNRIFLLPIQTKQLDMKTVHISAVDALNYKGFTEGEIKTLLDSLSPLENTIRAQQKFKIFFPSYQKITIGFSQNFSHNGGYQMLAYLYAATGDVNKTLQCLDSLKKYNPNYNKAFINSTNVSAYFLMYGKSKEFRVFVEAYAKVIGVPAHAFVKEILNSAGVMSVDCIIKFFKRGTLNDNLAFLDGALKSELFQATREFSRAELKTSDALNFNLALLSKLEGVLMAKKDKELSIKNNSQPDSLFQSAIDYYSKVSASFLEERIEVQIQTQDVVTEKKVLPRKHLFLYPDHYKTVESFNQPNWFKFYDDTYFNFMVENNLFSKLYKNQEDYQLIITWINSYFEMYGQTSFGQFLNYPDLGHTTFLALDSLIARSGYDLDDAWVKMILIEDYFNRGDTTNAYLHANALKFKEFEKVNEFGDGQPFHNNKIIVAGELAIRGKIAESMKIAKLFSNRKNRLKAYAKLAAICQASQKTGEAKVFLDSANAELKRLKSFQYNAPDFRLPLVEMLTLQSTRADKKLALEYIGSMQWFSRFNGVSTMVWSYARLDEYKKATESVPALASADDRLWIYDNILLQENLKRGNTSCAWQQYYKTLLESNYAYTYFQNDLLPE